MSILKSSLSPRSEQFAANRAAHEAASGTREVAESIGQVDAAAAETGQCAAQVNSASHALNTESSGLRKAVGEFLASVRAA